MPSTAVGHCNTICMSRCSSPALLLLAYAGSCPANYRVLLLLLCRCPCLSPEFCPHSIFCLPSFAEHEILRHQLEDAAESAAKLLATEPQGSEGEAQLEAAMQVRVGTRASPCLAGLGRDVQAMAGNGVCECGCEELL